MALALPAMASLVRLLWPTAVGEPAFVVFYPALVTSALLGGFCPGLVATIASAFCYMFWFDPVPGRFHFQSEVEWLRVTIFLAGGIGVSLLARRQRQASEAEKRRNEELQLIVSASDIGLWKWDLVTDDLDGDMKVKNIIGLPADQPIQSFNRVLERTHPEDRNRLQQRASELKDSIGDYEVEFRVTWPDGSIHWILAKGRSFDEASTGRPDRAMGVALDITARKDVEEILRRSDNRYRGIVEVSSAAVWTTHAEGRVVEDSPSWRRFTGQGLEQFLGWGWLQALHPEDRSSAEEAWRAAVKGKAAYETEYRLWHEPSGTYRHTRARGIPVLNDDGSISEWVGMNIDITDLKVAKECAEGAKSAAEQANRTKDHFLAVLSHELRTPLTPIVMGISMLQNKPDLDPKMRETLEMIRRNAEMEARLIDDLLDVTRIARGKVELKRGHVELGKIIEQAIEVCRPDIDGRRLHFGVDFGQDAPYWLEADESRLEQVFWNLLKNAIKFTPRGGCVGIRCRRDDGQVNIEVNDSGIGIEPEALTRVFNAFEQAEVSVTRQFGGLGLGLAISKALVEMHGGKIEAHSAGRHKGATFRIQLPLCAPGKQAHVRASGAIGMEEARPLHILLVEDHGVTAQMIRMILTEKGHQVELACDVASALELADRQTFDLLVSDLGLPDGSGYDLMKELRMRAHAFPGIALSGYGRDTDIQRSYQAGFAIHLTKPASREAVIDAVTSAAVGKGHSSTRIPADTCLNSRVYDADAALKRCLGKQEMLDKMVDFFHKDSIEQLNQIEVALGKGDTIQIGRAAHRLKGTVAHLCAKPAWDAAQKLEQVANSGDLSAAATAVRELESQVEVLRKALLSA